MGVRFELRGGPPGQAGESHLIEQAARCEALGFDAVWIAERSTRDGGMVPSALPACAAVLAATRSVRVVTGVLPLALHHPIRLAEDAATLDGIGQGRFELGVGLGSDAESQASWGVASDERAARFGEALDVVRRALRPGVLQFQGRYFQIAPVEVVPEPRTSGGPALWLGVRRVGAQRLAAAMGAGLLAPIGTDVSPYLEAFSEATPGAASETSDTTPVPRIAWLAQARDSEDPDAVVRRTVREHGPCEFVWTIGAEAGPQGVDALADRVLPLRDAGST